MGCVRHVSRAHFSCPAGAVRVPSRSADGLASVWAVATLARKTSVDTEILIYAVLDLLAFPIFGLWLLVSHRAMAETNIDLAGYWSQGLPAEGRIRIGDEE